MTAFIFLFIGLGIGFWFGRKTTPKNQEKEIKPTQRTYSYNQRQALKVMYATDADRIRELNLLSTNESIFLRLLKQEFLDKEIVVKQKRFFIVDSDKFPIAIFEYRDGFKPLHNSDVEDGLPVFLYKGLLSSDVIKEDAQRVADMARR
ncbi:hypothetical protein [Acinetobacter baumannii]|uniref:hypothetical protein n=1 Tax=Acinetobacter baumannii TaxID=470 RepID=UPI0002B94E8E|nr:hypothetical protein [Acinetobacter baumannii]EKU4533794.1 hypothetical protein [Acinetobacter baumannii]EKU4537661.1 hypothetical protein [Acinetobacter baumannii]EKV4019262.1 hypothetical protein [Acinetobacter baumannii]EKW0219249.1 hypothetical protein [Acinetobacter baumannii]EKX4017131.1 hypothetical protein [Acinetobacter baumannii]